MNRTHVQLTKIKFKKNEDILEIIIPSTVSFFIIWQCFLFILISPLMIFVFFHISEFGIFNIIVRLFLLGGLLSWFYQLTFTLFGQTRLRIDSQKIALSYKLFGILFYLRQSALRDNHSISKLVYIPRHFINTARIEIEEPGKLEIWVGAKNYQLSIPSNRVKNEVEIEWLVREISDWLGLPIQRE